MTFARVEDVVDSVSIIRERLHQVRFLMPPTVQHELANWVLAPPFNLTALFLQRSPPL